MRKRTPDATGVFFCASGLVSQTVEPLGSGLDFYPSTALIVIMSRISELLQQASRLHRAGRLVDAAELCDRVLQVDSEQPFALDLLGQIAMGKNAFEHAENYFVRASAALPASAAFQFHHGLVLRRLGKNAVALAAFARALTLDPKLTEAHHQAGNLLKAARRYPEAIAALRKAVRLESKNATAWLNLGVAYLENKAPEDAIASFRRALKLEPNRAEAQNILGHALLTVGRTAEAEASLTTALRLQPGYAPALDNLGRLCRASGRLPEAITFYRAALAQNPDPSTHSNLLFALNFLPGIEPQEIFTEHRRWHENYAAWLAPLQPPPVLPRNPGERLRVGYISPDFAHHAVAYFIEPVLSAHDRSSVEVFCYASVAAPDRFTERLKAHAEHWRDIAQLNDEDAANLIRRDRLHLLIDLAGHTAHHRLLVLARRPAPVQATWIGYPNTTGLAAIDYRITDAVSDPAGLSEASYSERLVRLPTTFSCYRPDDEAPLVNELPAMASGVVTFGSFNQFAKVTPEVIALWARLLLALPGARLLLKSPGLGESGIAIRVREDFARLGVAPERITLNGERTPVLAHLSLYHGVDIALDPFPYNGTTTTCEALWMGVPVLTLAGHAHVSRVGVSLLTHAGLTDWIATSPDDYLARAVAATQNLAKLAELRETLRERIRLSLLCDATRFTRGLENCFDAMSSRSF